MGKKSWRYWPIVKKALTILFITFFSSIFLPASFFYILTILFRDELMLDDALFLGTPFCFVFVILFYCFVNNKIVTIVDGKKSLKYLFFFCIFYYILRILFGYFYLFAFPLIFFFLLGMQKGEKQLKYILLSNFLTLIVCVMFFFIIKHYVTIKILYKVIKINKDYFFDTFILSYYGIFHFLLVLFNIKTIASLMYAKK